MFVYLFLFFLIHFFLLIIDAVTGKDTNGQAAKGKRFTVDYDLLCYKIVFQLAVKQDNIIMISHIKCETNIINERKYITLTYIEINKNEYI